MQPFGLKFAAPAERDLLRLHEPIAAAIVEFVTGALLEDPHRVGKPLGLDLSEHRVARRGAYRVVYRIDDAEHLVVVTRIDHRGDIFRPR